ncbi:MAG: right-handed parallel beta-helix repeat-containing protein [Chloroflexota bacterium]
MAKTYYVSAEQGNDKNAGTEKKPLKTIQAGVNKLSAGDTLLVKAGTYSEQAIINRSGDSNKPITIKAYQNDKPVIKGNKINIARAARLVSFTRCQYVTFAGFEVQSSSGRGIGLKDCKFVTVSDCEVHKCVSNGIFAIDCEDITIERNKIHDCAQKYAATSNDSVSIALVLARCENATVQENQCYENSSGGIGALYTRSITIQKNTCYDNRASQIKFSSSRDLTIDANFCYHTGRKLFLHLNGGRPPGIVKDDRKGYTQSGVWHTRNVMVANNFVVGCSSGFQCARYGGALTSINMNHNTFVNSTEASIDIQATDTHRDTLLENNLIATTNGASMAQIASPGGLLWRFNFWSQYPTDDTFNPANDIVDPNTGLRDIDAPLTAGATTTAPYELTAVSPAVNSGILSDVSVDFYGRTRDSKPDLGAHEFDNSSGSGSGTEPLPEPGERVTEGLQVLYDFSAGWGNTVTDTSGVGSALNLTIQNTAAVQWSNDGLIVKSPTTISSSGPATKVIDACKASNEITIEAWIKPATTEQGGPARVVSISADTNNRNVTMAQGLKSGDPTSLYNVRLRTSDSDNNGIPSVSTPQNSLLTEMSHVVFTRDNTGNAIIYINGQERVLDKLGGNLNNWAANYRLLLANELTGDRPWLGTYTLIAVFDRALSEQEVQHNYSAGLPEVDPIAADFRIGAGQEIGLAPHTVDFDSSDSYSANGIAAYAWDFGDSGTSTEANPTHIYESVGIYNVSLTITDQNGLTSAITKTGLITVTDAALPSLPVDYARFVLANVVESRVMGFGIQYTDYRCVLAWNEDPYQIMIFRTVEDVLEAYRVPGTVELVWVDYPTQEITE